MVAKETLPRLISWHTIGNIKKANLWDEAGNLLMVVCIQLQVVQQVVSVAGLH